MEFFVTLSGLLPPLHFSVGLQPTLKYYGPSGRKSFSLKGQKTIALGEAQCN